MANSYKLCPYCAEEIKAAAVLCKHCGRELPGYKKASPKKTTPKGLDAFSIWAVSRRWAFWVALLSLFAIPLGQSQALANAQSELASQRILSQIVSLTATGVPLNYLLALVIAALITWISRRKKWLWVLAGLASSLLFFFLYGMLFPKPPEGNPTMQPANATFWAGKTQTAAVYASLEAQTAEALSEILATEQAARLGLPSNCIAASEFDWELLLASPLDTSLEYCLIAIVSTRSSHLMGTIMPKYFTNEGNFLVTLRIVDFPYVRIADSTSMFANVLPGQCIVAVGNFRRLSVIELSQASGGPREALERQGEEILASTPVLDTRGEIYLCQ